MSVQITAHLGEERRSFQFKDTSIEQLRAILASLFNIEQNFRLAYVDEEGDLITFSSSLELKEAIHKPDLADIIIENPELELHIQNATKLPPTSTEYSLRLSSPAIEAAQFVMQHASPVVEAVPEEASSSTSASDAFVQTDVSPATNALVQTEAKPAFYSPLPPSAQRLAIQAAILKLAFDISEPMQSERNTVQEATEFLRIVSSKLPHRLSSIEVAESVVKALESLEQPLPAFLESELIESFSTILEPQETATTVFLPQVRNDDDFVLVSDEEDRILTPETSENEPTISNPIPAPVEDTSPAPAPAPVSTLPAPIENIPAPAPFPISTLPAPAPIESPNRVPHFRGEDETQSKAPIDALTEFDPLAPQNLPKDPSEVEMFDTSRFEFVFPGSEAKSDIAPVSAPSTTHATASSTHATASSAPTTASSTHAAAAAPSTHATASSHTSAPLLHTQTPSYPPPAFSQQPANPFYSSPPPSFPQPAFPQYSHPQPAYPQFVPPQPYFHSQPAQPQHPNPYGTRWINELRQLHEMGFRDDEKNVAALESFNGNINTTITFLISDN